MGWVTSPGLTPASVKIQDGGSSLLAVVSPDSIDGAAVNTNFLWTTAAGLLLNGSTLDRTRSASAANLAAQSGLGAALVAPPGMWVVSSAPAVNVQASAVRAAGGAGIRHVTWGTLATLVSDGTAPGATETALNLLDGVSVLESIGAPVQAVAGYALPPIQQTGKNLPGSAATSMTLQFSGAAGAHTAQAANLSGYDAS
jgi:hypothetical protein